MTEPFDTVVVGVGSAGRVLANRLSADPARRVLLLEAGRAAPRASTVPAHWPSMLGSEVDRGFHTELQAGCQQRRMYWPRGRMTGGSGTLNAMIYMRGVPSDYARWEVAGCPGWGWRDAHPVFRRSERNLRFGSTPWHGGECERAVSDAASVDPVERLWLAAARAAGLPVNDFIGATQAGVGLVQASILDGERCGTARAFLAPAQGRRNLVVRSGVTVLRITFDGARASGVELMENGRPHHEHADAEVVLCAGAIGSPHLLLHSGIGPPTNSRRSASVRSSTCPASASACKTIRTARSPSRPRNADPQAAPAIDPRYFSDSGDADLALLVEGIRLNREILRQSPIREVPGAQSELSDGATDNAALRALIRAQCTTLCHPTGTCRMGSDALAVVDPALRVRGAERSFVADASVFSSMVSGNTNAPVVTVVTVAERAANLIRHRGTARARQPETTR